MLENFKTEYRFDKTVTNIVICIYRKPAKDADSSHINRTLAQLFKELEKRKEKTAVAYTFGDDIVDARDFSEPEDDRPIPDLSDVIFYMDFSGIFDRSDTGRRQLLRQQKARDMFRPEGVCLDFGSGQHR